ncbi:hypothetical protein [Lewinella sp. 4G2]|uniref:hypothetical protein n=1 Tax=Lewinella sp. 4G2 TaxID=1803372 RepID=UPI0007B46415|nr:hypothetical protein [Lewinella sp. 4G2]OAV44052.1 hypothetical protein A3850_005875 [Lewinella sp. 4G2]
MTILKSATDWAKAELVSTPFFILAGILFLVASIGFWQLGKTELARAYIIPTLVAGVLLVIIGTGLFFTNRTRLAEFPVAYERDAAAFVAAERVRAEATLKEYDNVVFTAIPILIAACAIALLFLSGPGWRAALITTIAFLVVLLLIDGTAYARIYGYQQALNSVEEPG